MDGAMEVLRFEQAEIRDNQRMRFDEIHALSHEYERNVIRETIGTVIRRRDQVEMVKKIHNVIHLIMHDFDYAVLIHERMAQLEGRDSAKVTKALLPVRTVER